MTKLIEVREAYVEAWITYFEAARFTETYLRTSTPYLGRVQVANPVRAGKDAMRNYLNSIRLEADESSREWHSAKLEALRVLDLRKLYERKI